MASNQLHWVDYLVFIIVLAITTGIGAVFSFIGGRQKTTNEYFTGDRRLNVLLTSVSIVVTYMSAVMVIGVPVEAYSYGGQLILGSVGQAIGMCLAAAVVVPVLYPLKLLSVNKYLEMRYNSRYPKLFATGLNIVQSTSYAAVVLIAPSSAVSSLLGVPVWSVIIVSAALAIFYTTIGGIKAVVWSDTFLCVCMVSGMLLMCVQIYNGDNGHCLDNYASEFYLWQSKQGVKSAGGLGSAYQISLEGGRLDLFNFSPNPTERLTLWSMLFGIGFNGFSLYGTVQPIVQRYSNVQSVTKAQVTVVLAVFGNMCMYILPVSAGLSIYAYYKHIGCDPIGAKIISKQNELVPHFIMEKLNFPGIPGLFIASLAAGSLSSVSSVLNSSAANIWDDILKDRIPERFAKRGAFISKIVVVIMGTLTTLFCFILLILGGTVYQLSMSITSITVIPMVGMVLHGMFCPWINSKGILTGGISGMVFVMWIVSGQYYNTIYTAEKLPTDISQCISIGSEVNQTIGHYSNTNLTYYTETDGKNNSTIDNMDRGMEKYTFLTGLYSISYTWYILMGNIIILIIGTIASLATGGQKLNYDQVKLISPFCRRFCSFPNKQTHPLEKQDKETSQMEFKEESEEVELDSLIEKH